MSGERAAPPSADTASLAPTDKDAPLRIQNPQVQYFLDRFTGTRRKIVAAWLSRSVRYLGMIRDILRRHDLPEDLAFVPMVESGYDPLAVSRAGAKGLWQLMADTARRYGLRVDQWVDERFDPERSTMAAVAYFRDLHAMFDSWDLAHAAYNAGEMTVVRAIRLTRSNDFWTLARTGTLRQETKDFIPQIEAATLIGRNPSKYGFETEPFPRTGVDVVSVPPSTRLSALAMASGIPLERLRALNPVLVKGLTPPDSRWGLRVPLGARDALQAALTAPTRLAAATPHPPDHVLRASTQVKIHVVRPRDTLRSIARRYGVSVGDVIRWNRLQHHDRIHPGDRLRVAESRQPAEAGNRLGSR